MQVRSRPVGATITAESTPAFKPAWQSHWISASRPVVQLTAKRFARIVPGASSHSVLSRRGRDRRSQQCERGRPRASCWGSSGQCSSAARVTLVAVAILRVCPAVAAGPPGLAGEQFQRRPTPVLRTCRAPSLSWPLAGRRIARSSSRCPPARCDVSRTPILTSATHLVSGEQHHRCRVSGIDGYHQTGPSEHFVSPGPPVHRTPPARGPRRQRLRIPAAGCQRESAASAIAGQGNPRFPVFRQSAEWRQ